MYIYTHTLEHTCKTFKNYSTKKKERKEKKRKIKKEKEDGFLLLCM